MYGNYRCKECNCLVEYKKKYGEEFPEEYKIVCMSGNHDSDATCTVARVFESVPVIDVAVGRLGNSKNGYNTDVMYTPSPYSPLDKVYGKYGRTSMYNKDGTVTGKGAHESSQHKSNYD